jgi:hypothetical protein
MRFRFLLFAFLLALSASAQDTLFKRNREILVVKVVEIGLNEIKYKNLGREDGPVIAISKDRLSKIVFADGVTQRLIPEMVDPENYSGQRTNAIKLDFMSPLRNNLSFAYERSLHPGASVEMNLGIVGIGVGTEDWEKSSGAFIRLGYKFIRTPDFYLPGMRYSHVLKGPYIRPDLIFGTYRIDHEVSDNYFDPNPPYNYLYTLNRTDRQKITYGAFHLSLGKQWVYDDVFLVDLFFGCGYVFSGQSGDVQEGNYSILYGVTGSSRTPLSGSAGIRIGVLL